MSNYPDNMRDKKLEEQAIPTVLQDDADEIVKLYEHGQTLVKALKSADTLKVLTTEDYDAFLTDTYEDRIYDKVKEHEANINVNIAGYFEHENDYFKMVRKRNDSANLASTIIRNFKTQEMRDKAIRMLQELEEQDNERVKDAH